MECIVDSPLGQSNFLLAKGRILCTSHDSNVNWQHYLKKIDLLFPNALVFPKICGSTHNEV